jgi:hypothetical protein
MDSESRYHYHLVLHKFFLTVRISLSASPPETSEEPDKQTIDYPRFEGALTVQPTDLEWIDNNVLKRWKRKCDQEHSCRKPPKQNELSELVRPTFLIDVRMQCVVLAPEDSSYIALSYVW